jgi:hypothetical protein
MGGLSSEPEKAAALVTMIPLIHGKPCVNVTSDGSVCVSRRIFGIRVEWDSIGQSVFYQLLAKNAWVDPPRKRPDSLTEGLAIGSDCLEVGPTWWFDTYFRWWFVFDPALVARTVAGDHSWVGEFRQSLSRPGAGRQPEGRNESPTKAKPRAASKRGSKTPPSSRSRRRGK